MENTENNIMPKENMNEKEVLAFEYNVTNEEEGQAFLLFQKRYVYKKNWIKTAAFAAAAILFAISSYRSPEQPLNYILGTICVAAIAIIWYNTKKIRTSLMDALKMIEDDRYIFTLFDKGFKIETIQTEELDENGEPLPPIPPREVNFADITLHVFDTPDKFVLVLKKDTIYVLPKRCMNAEQIDILKKAFSEKLGQDYEVVEK